MNADRTCPGAVFVLLIAPPHPLLRPRPATRTAASNVRPTGRSSRSLRHSPAGTWLPSALSTIGDAGEMSTTSNVRSTAFKSRPEKTTTACVASATKVRTCRASRTYEMADAPCLLMRCLTSALTGARPFSTLACTRRCRRPSRRDSCPGPERRTSNAVVRRSAAGGGHGSSQCTTHAVPSGYASRAVAATHING